MTWLEKLLALIKPKNHKREGMFQIVRMISLSVLCSLTFASCSFYKPEVATNKCVGNEECGKGYACRDGRCEDIYFPKRKIRQY